MKKILLFLTLFSFCYSSFSQAISVNTTTYTVPQLVQNVLFGSTASAACAGTLSNITWSTGTNYGSTNGIGYFTNTNPAFPLANGVVLSTGNVASAPGPNTVSQSAGNAAWVGDTQLFNYIQSLGIDPGLNSYNNATVLQFDFVPLSNTMSFDFLFASEEYGTYQCDYSDAFAFFLTNLTTSSAPINLALVPGTIDPISVTTIRDGAYFSGFGTNCGSLHDNYFGFFNNGTTATAGTATNFNGQTVRMTAGATVIPNNTYHIKLVIADRNDNSFDSAVFLGGGSFNIGSVITSGSGFTNPSYTVAGGTAICFGGTRDIVFGASAIPGATYTWYQGTTAVSSGPSNTYSVTQPGSYTVSVSLPSGCSYTSTNNFLVEFYAPLPLSQPIDLTEPTGVFNIGSNTQVMLGTLNPSDYDISYHSNLPDAQNIANPIGNLITFPGTNGQIIYAVIQDLVGAGCVEIRPFVLYTTCSTITLPSSNQSLCIGSDPASFSVATSFSGVDAISYVYFNSAQTGSNMYSGGTLLSNVTPATNSATYNAPVLGSLGSLPNVAGTYYVYAIANPTPTDVTCRPFQEIQVVVNPQVNAGTDGSTILCETSSTAINLYSLITGEQTGGTWTRSSGTGGVFNAATGTFTPAVGATTSTFTYAL
ncbi:choice-of-anchor L domain-containing protein, partial [Flavobacterium sp.]|uniref:choice-of-anchor L domain-containing protein n=1 Tax=Flavobacterium sp. TaxID=239 RepID=UPI003750FFCD